MAALRVRSPAPTSRRRSRAPATNNASERRALENCGRKGDGAAVVQRRLADLVHRAADAQQPLAFRHQPLQPPAVPEIEHIEQVASAPHIGNEGQLVVVV
jgi:hypothetical protein